MFLVRHAMRHSNPTSRQNSEIMLSKRVHSHACMHAIPVTCYPRYTPLFPRPISGTCCSSFSGVIDHIFVSTGEKNSGMAISGVLAFPRGARLVKERTAIPQEPGKGDPSNRRRATAPPPTELPVGEVRDGRKQTDGPAEEEFPPIPNERWGSDHLALGVEVALR